MSDARKGVPSAMSRSCLLLAVAVALGRAGPSVAADFVPGNDDGFVLHVDGSSLHFKQNGQDYENYGLGFAYPIGRFAGGGALIDGTRMDFEFDGYRDSYDEPAWAGGLVFTRHLAGPVDWGLKAGLVHTETLLSEGHIVYPYVLPFVESAFDFPLALRVTFVPPWGKSTNGEFTFQLMVEFNKF